MEDYFIFAIAYDLMGDVFHEHQLTCDEAFHEAYSIYNDFLTSDFNDVNYSEYDCLKAYIDSKK